MACPRACASIACRPRAWPKSSAARWSSTWWWVGFFSAVTARLDPDALRQSVAGSVPESFRDLNLWAYDKGYEHGATLLHERAEGRGELEEWLASLEREV